MDIFKIILICSLAHAIIPTAVTQHHLSTAPISDHLFIQQAHDYSSSSSSSGWWVGFILGPLLFFCSFVCIWFNQKRAAIDSRRLELARTICEDVDVTSQASARSKNGKLVWANGITRTSAIIGDNLSRVSGPNLIKISRLVQVLEWRKKTRKDGDRTVEYYDMEWVSSNSENEGERFNPKTNWFIENDTIYNQQVYLGGYNISKEVADKCSRFIPFTPTMEHAQNIMANTHRLNKTPSLAGEYIYFSDNMSGNNYPNNQGYQPNQGYPPNQGFGGNQGPGTLRVKFLLCPTGEMSLVGESAGTTFSSFNIAKYEGTAEQTNSFPDCCCCCCISACYAELLKPIEQILQVYEQNMQRQAIFQKAIEKSEYFTRCIRILSFLCMVFGIYLFFSPIVNLIGFIPLVGGIISGILGFAILLAAFLISIPLYILMTAIAWLFFHPKIGLILLAIGGVILAVVLILGRNKGDSSSPQTQAHFMGLLFRHELS